MKKLILMLLVLAGGVMEGWATYYIKGSMNSWGDGYEMTQYGTTSYYTCYIQNVSLAVGNLEYKVYNGESWYPTGDNLKYAISSAESNDLLFVYHENESLSCTIINYVDIRGTFNSWSSNAMATSDGLVFTKTLDLTDCTETDFKLVIKKDNDNENTAWLGYSDVTLEDPSGFTGVVGPSASDGNCWLSNIVRNYSDFTITATWNPTSANFTTGWTLNVAPKTERSSISKVLYYNTNSWDKVYAHSWNPAEPVKELNKAWPGEFLTKTNSDGLYTYYYTTSYSKIIFNDGTGGTKGETQTEDLDFVANKPYNISGVVSTQTVNPGSEGYATFSCDYPLDFTGITDVKAYRAESVGSTRVNFTRVSGKVPANTGLFIYGTSTSVPTTATPSAIGTNLLKPTTGSDIYDTSDSKVQYVFAKQSGDLGFYKVDSSLSPAEGKAYLETTGSSARLSIVLDDEDITGINTVKATAAQNDGYYNLAGQRVAQPAKGLYIVNGKKVIIK